MKKEEKFRVEGIVIENLPGTTFRVQLDTVKREEVEEPKTILAYLSGKMRVRYIRIVPGDRVVVELSSYDSTRGRIVYRR